jgi:PAS domain S-box-containing protein
MRPGGPRTGARQRFGGAFEDAPIGMAAHGHDGALLQVNAQLCRLLGRGEGMPLTLGLDDLVHPEDRRESQAERRQVIAGSISVGRRETRLLHADGRIVGVMLSSSIVRRDDEQVELVVHIEDISERKALEARLTHQALHDSLTHLPNRARVLTAIAKRFAALVRPGDTAARFGGDEFTILCEGADATEARVVAERIAEAIEAPITLPRQGDLRPCASIGIATAASAAISADMLLRDANMAMYAAKGTDVRIEVFERRDRPGQSPSQPRHRGATGLRTRPEDSAAAARLNGPTVQRTLAQARCTHTHRLSIQDQIRL